MKGIQQLLQAQGFRMISTMCVESTQRKKIGALQSLQKRLKFRGNVKNKLLLVIFTDEKIKNFLVTLDKVFANLLTTPYVITRPATT